MTVAAVERPTRSPYFPIVGILLFALGILAFSDNLFTDISQPSNSDPKFLVHGFFALIWFTVLAIQPSLIAAGRVSLHRKLGTVGAVGALGLVLTTAYLQYLHFLRNDGLSGLALINSILAAAFAVCVGLAIANRHRPELHKRLMLVGSFLILEPLASRAAGHLGLSPMLFVPLLWFALFLSMIAHDRLVLRRFTLVPFAGFGFLLGVLVLVPLN